MPNLPDAVWGSLATGAFIILALLARPIVAWLDRRLRSGDLRARARATRLKELNALAIETFSLARKGGAFRDDYRKVLLRFKAAGELVQDPQVRQLAATYAAAIEAMLAPDGPARDERLATAQAAYDAMVARTGALLR